ncbi:MAG: UvrD-helicase domain-containing protein [Bacteroidetes bacterium]|nr:UvrD-helicase domain-containing protein [Bacteroidota bacterium]
MEHGYMNDLSPAQRSAVEHVAGPLLIVAGAGSGKTRVLTCRIARLLQMGTPPNQILALTFTNKAAGEMKERIGRIAGTDNAGWLWMGTFHSIFARILRYESEYTGFPSSFTIYDKADSKSAIKSCIKELELDDKRYLAGEVLSRISKAKNNLVTASAYAVDPAIQEADAAASKSRIADIYRLYAQKCRVSGAMDFDDLLLYTNILFRDHPQVLEKYQARFTHILVDEYQDTNFAQYLIVKKLALSHRNLCVVGDDAQSIYAFRGARIENILNFRRDFPEGAEYRLEQNYRSTQTIVNAANSLIRHNAERLTKECFSQGVMGEKIEVIKAYSDLEEAYMVVASIVSRQYASHASYDDFAILYRTNAQSRVLEASLRKRNIPYKIYGGFSFYERAEVKEVLAYLRLLVNPRDDEALKRIINVPARGIGEATLQKVQAAARGHQISMWEEIRQGTLAEYGVKQAAENKLKTFVEMMGDIASRQYSISAYDFAIEALTRSGYWSELKNDLSAEGKTRLENVEELFNSMKEFSRTGEIEEDAEGATIHAFLANVALITDLEETDDHSEPKVSLMTMHAAKGLEFKYTYVVGLEENLFPSNLSLGSQRELEEERRLFYVALTRAKVGLSLSYAQTRYRWGTLTHNSHSRFLQEIDARWLRKSIQDEIIPPSTTTPVPFKSALRSRSPDSGFISAEQGSWSAGQKIEHDRFGLGTIISITGNHPAERKAVVEFERYGTKTLLLKYAKMKTIL